MDSEYKPSSPDIRAIERILEDDRPGGAKCTEIVAKYLHRGQDDRLDFFVAVVEVFMAREGLKRARKRQSAAWSE